MLVRLNLRPFRPGVFNPGGATGPVHTTIVPRPSNRLSSGSRTGLQIVGHLHQRTFCRDRSFTAATACPTGHTLVAFDLLDFLVFLSDFFDFLDFLDFLDFFAFFFSALRFFFSSFALRLAAARAFFRSRRAASFSCFFSRASAFFALRAAVFAWASFFNLSVVTYRPCGHPCGQTPPSPSPSRRSADVSIWGWGRGPVSGGRGHGTTLRPLLARSYRGGVGSGVGLRRRASGPRLAQVHPSWDGEGGPTSKRPARSKVQKTTPRTDGSLPLRPPNPCNP